jgi:NAD(P)-dependent dehydrogenase (short-subunit alcohol dehydrogenase family)
MKKVIVITGGAGGMGLATAQLLVKDGYQVVLSDIDEERLIHAAEQLGENKSHATTIVCDITNRQSVDTLMQTAAQQGRVVGTVHSAGVSPQMGEAAFIMRINALGTINVTEASLAIAEEGFSLVNIASIAGHMTPKLFIPKRTYRLAFSDPEKLVNKLTKKSGFAPKRMRPGQAYSLSKNFVIWYSAKVAAAFGAKGARVVSVSPGSFDTDMGRLEKATVALNS